MATKLPWLSPSQSHIYNTHFRTLSSARHVAAAQAFRRSDFDGFAKRMASGQSWRDAWRRANDGFEQFLFDARKTAERLDRHYSVSRRFSSITHSAAYRAREIDRDFQIGRRCRSFTADFARNLPRTEAINELGGYNPWCISDVTTNHELLEVSEMIIHTRCKLMKVKPLINQLPFVVDRKGACPACKNRFMGYRNQVIRCPSCGNIVWQPKGDFFSKGGKGRAPSSSASDPDIIDVEFEEK